jgi:hypothetical protein
VKVQDVTRIIEEDGWRSDLPTWTIGRLSGAKVSAEGNGLIRSETSFEGGKSRSRLSLELRRDFLASLF